MVEFVPRFRYAIWSVKNMAHWWTGRLEKNRQLLSCWVVFLLPQHQFSPNLCQFNILETFAHRVWPKAAYKLGGRGRGGRAMEGWRRTEQEIKPPQKATLPLQPKRFLLPGWGKHSPKNTISFYNKNYHRAWCYHIWHTMRKQTNCGQRTEPGTARERPLPSLEDWTFDPYRCSQSKCLQVFSKCPSNFLCIKVLSLTFLSPERIM